MFLKYLFIEARAVADDGSVVMREAPSEDSAVANGRMQPRVCDAMALEHAVGFSVEDEALRMNLGRRDQSIVSDCYHFHATAVGSSVLR